MFEIIIEYLSRAGSLITSLTIVGGALMWVYNKTVAQPREKKRKQEADERERNRLEHERKQQEILTNALKPINEFIQESRSDRIALNKIALENTKKLQDHDKQINDIDDRLIVVETTQGIHGKTVQYTEIYKGDGK